LDTPTIIETKETYRRLRAAVDETIGLLYADIGRRSRDRRPRPHSHHDAGQCRARGRLRQRGVTMNVDVQPVAEEAAP
jgi:hypothetical protein